MEKTNKKRSPWTKSTKKNRGGRPPVMTKETLQKLERAFSMGLPDEQSCLYADIAPQTLYNYQNKHPEFLERKKLLKQNITMHARLNIATMIQAWSAEDSWKWLERKERWEFAPKEQQTIQIANQNVLIQLPPLQLPDTSSNS